MVDEDKFLDEDDELDPALLEDDLDDDELDIPDEEEENEDLDDLDPKHLNSLGFGVEEEDF